MQRLSATQKQYLKEATSRYVKSLPGSPAEEHLANRGFRSPATRAAVDRFKLGYVDEPLPGHKMFQGMLAIPYLRRSETNDQLVVAIRFRCLEDHSCTGHGKYNTVSGEPARLYNTVALTQADDTIAITEGEMDAIALSVLGIPAVGVPGVQTWKDHFTAPFLGYERVYVFTDGDDAGDGFGTFITEKLSNAKQIPCPRGEDVNSWVMQGGRNELLGAMK